MRYFLGVIHPHEDPPDPPGPPSMIAALDIHRFICVHEWAVLLSVYTF